MKTKIFGWIGVVWGALILSRGGLQILTGQISGGAYGAGQLVAIVFGALLMYAGIRALKLGRTGSPE